MFIYVHLVSVETVGHVFAIAFDLHHSWHVMMVRRIITVVKSHSLVFSFSEFKGEIQEYRIGVRLICFYVRNTNGKNFCSFLGFILQFSILR